MKSVISFPWWRRCGLVVAGVALTISPMLASPSVVRANIPEDAIASEDAIARKLLVLQSSSERWIQIDLTRQNLTAWEGGKPVYAITISTGKESTPTPPGTFAIQTKYERARMTGPGYDVPDVPFTMYYYGGYAIHGAYWHNNFGTPVSHGCTNVAVNHAEWLFNWASVGTPVVVHY